MSIRILFAAVVLGGPFALPAAFGQAVDAHNGESVRAGEKQADQTPGPDLAAVVKAIIEQTNSFRKQEGREAVQPNEHLTATAQYFADYMARTNEYGHEADGKKPAERAKEHDYDYCLVSENIAYAFDSTGFTAEKLTEQFVTGWKESPGHRKNMLDPDVTETGVAVARSEETGYYYAVQMFGRPKSAALEFKVENRAGEAIEYAIGEETFSLPPRYTRTHTRCRPAELTFRWPAEGQDPATVKPASGDHFVVSGEAGTFRVAKKE